MQPTGTRLVEALRRGPLGSNRIPGSTLGPYLIEGELGGGAMGIVFRARHQSGQVVALKVLIAGQSASEQQRKRFLREMTLSAQVSAPGIVPIRDSGEADGLTYLALEFIEGTTLEAVFEDEHDWERRVDLILKVAYGLAPAHTQGILHRDLKPANVLVRASDGQTLVTDFGLARSTDLLSSLTKTGGIVGTPAYMAPEQIKASKSISVAADVFALGVMLYEALCAERPFNAPNPAVRQVAEGGGPPPTRGHAAAYDSDRGVVLVFGGGEGWGKGLRNDMWSWGGSTWSKVKQPKKRQYHAMAYDERRKKLVLFGGRARTRPPLRRKSGTLCSHGSLGLGRRELDTTPYDVHLGSRPAPPPAADSRGAFATSPSSLRQLGSNASRGRDM